MKISDIGLKLIKHYEGFYPSTYLCPARVPTIGYGTTRIGGKPIPTGMVITEQKASGYLMEEVNMIEKQLVSCIKTSLSQNQWDAIYSFVYNLGITNFSKSTLLKCINKNNFTQASTEFLKWNKAAGKELKGLTNRRRSESILFSSNKLELF